LATPFCTRWSFSVFAAQALPFDDGSPPPDAIIENWLHIVKEVNFPSASGKKPAAAGGAGGGGNGKDEEKPAPCIAIHCVAGLGRAPLMVTLALVTAGIPYTKAVELIRAKRCVVDGAFFLRDRAFRRARGWRRPCTAGDLAVPYCLLAARGASFPWRQSLLACPGLSV
jgi:hypothetical protein